MENRKNEERLEKIEQFLSGELGFKNLKPGIVHEKAKNNEYRITKLEIKPSRVKIGDIELTMASMIKIFIGICAFGGALGGTISAINDNKYVSRKEFVEIKQELTELKTYVKLRNQKIDYIHDYFEKLEELEKKNGN